MHRTQTVCLLILATIAVSFSLASLKTVLLPFVIALFIVIGCRPILHFVEDRLGLHRYFAWGFTFLAGILICCAFAVMVWASIIDLANNADAYEERLDHIAAWIIDKIPESNETPTGPDSASLESSETVQPVTDQSSVETALNTDEIQMPEVHEDPRKTLRSYLSFATTYIESQVLRLASSLSSILSYGVLVLIFVFFLLLESPDTGNDSASRRQTGGIVNEVEVQIRQYLVMKTAISLVTGLAFGLVLWLFGVPLAILFGFLAFILNFIPNIGPLISTVLPIPFLILNSNMSPTVAVLCFLVCAAIHFVSGNIVETRIMGKSFDVSPVFLLLALMFFGLIWGIVGMFLATPIVSIIKIILQQTEMGKPIAELMAGRWTPVDPVAS